MAAMCTGVRVFLGPDPVHAEFRTTRLTPHALCCSVHNSSDPDIPTTVSRVPLNSVAPGASVTPRPYADAKPAVRGRVFCPGITFNCSLPIVYQSCHANELISVNNRACAPPPPHDDPTVLALEQFVDEHFDILFPGGRDSLQHPTRFGDWNARFPGSRRAEHVVARTEGHLAGETSKATFRRKTFVKSNEKMQLSDDVGFEDKAPRTIQGATSDLNVVVGPWLHKFSERLAAVWHPEHFITYTSGLDQVGLGRCYEQMLHPGNVLRMLVLGDDNLVSAAGQFFENDFAKFDSTIHIRLLELGRRVYARFGVPPHILAVLERMDKKVGCTPHGVKYKVPGTRASGDADTSSGNSLLNGLCVFFALWRCGICDHAGSIKRPLGPADVPVIAGTLAALGLRPEPFLRDAADATYCSGGFVPHSTGYCYVPLLGKLLPKLGFYVNPPTAKFARAVAFADAAAFLTSYPFVPFLRVVASNIMRVMAAHSHQRADSRVQAYLASTAGVRRDTAAQFVATDETWDWFEQRYGLSRLDEEHLRRALDACAEAPCHVASDIVRRMAQRDIGRC